MVNYNNAKIYKIIPINGDDESDIYFGSTTKEFLSQRMVYHRHDYRKWKNGKHHYCSIYAMFEKHGIENCKIVLLENVNANSKDEMLAREAYYIRNFKCINKNIPLRKVNEFMHEYNMKNKEKIEEKRKVKVTCECGSICRKDGLREHKKTKKHIDFINNQNLNPI